MNGDWCNKWGMRNHIWWSSSYSMLASSTMLELQYSSKYILETSSWVGWVAAFCNRHDGADGSESSKIIHLSTPLECPGFPSRISIEKALLLLRAAYKQHSTDMHQSSTSHRRHDNSWAQIDTQHSHPPSHTPSVHTQWWQWHSTFR